MRISRFFIDRPIFAAVLSLVFVIFGIVSFGRLPVAQYPEIAPPVINVTGQYPGASADVVAATVVTPLEQQINGVENMEMNGAAYLLPVDAKLEKDTHVNDETIALDRVLEKVEGARRLKLVILDACRNNPFLARMARSANSTRSVGKGLPALEPEGDVLVAYATKHGTTALDGDGENSPYAKALVEHIPAPNVDIRVLFGRVRDTVRKTTRNQQEPYTYGSIGGDLHFLAALAAH